jgi:hypothetical protein
MMIRTAAVRNADRGRRPAQSRLLIALIALCVLAPAGCAARRDPNGPPLQLHSGAWGPRFSYEGPVLQSVYDWTSLDTAFVAVLSRDATALEEARKSKPFRTGALISYAGVTLFTTKMMFTAFSSASSDDITQGDVDSVNRDLVVAVGFSLAAAVFDQVAHRYIRRGASTFNVGETSASGRQGSLPDWIEQSVRNLSLSPTFRPHSGFGLVSRTTLYLR